MKRSQRINRLADIKRQFEDQAGQQLAAAKSQYLSQQAKLDQLLQYKSEYSQRMSNGQVSLEAEQLRDYQQFFSKLDVAVKQQEVTLQHAQAEVERCHNEWLQRHQQTQSMEKVSIKLQTRENQAASQQEQIASDERNQHHRGSPWQE